VVVDDELDVLDVFWTFTDSLVDTLEPSEKRARAASVCVPFANLVVSRLYA